MDWLLYYSFWRKPIYKELDVTIYAYDYDHENPRKDDDEIFYYGLSKTELLWLELTQEVIDDFRVIEVYQ